MSRRSTDQSALVRQMLASMIRRATPRQLALGAGVLFLALAATGIYNWSRGPEGLIRFPGPEPAAIPGGNEPSEPLVGTWYQVHFTEPTGRRVSTAPREGGIDVHLVDLINRAAKTLDVAAYDFDLLSIAEAMATAQARGVRVRLVIDTDTLAKVEDTSGRHGDVSVAINTVRSAGIPIVDDKRNAIMHNKFSIIDGEWLQTGSWNYSKNDTFNNNNNMVIFRSRELAENYTAEFERLFEGKFSPALGRPIPNPVLAIGEATIRNAFSPISRRDRKVSTRVIEAIEESKTSIHFLAFQFTNNAIGKAIRDRAAAGVSVGGVFENTGSQTEHSEFTTMKEAGLDVLTDGNPFVMHHKVIILDGKTVVFGSYNFSDNADNDNNENLLIVDHPGFARHFEAEYERVRAVAQDPPRRR